MTTLPVSATRWATFEIPTSAAKNDSRQADGVGRRSGDCFETLLAEPIGQPDLRDDPIAADEDLAPGALKDGQDRGTHGIRRFHAMWSAAGRGQFGAEARKWIVAAALVADLPTTRQRRCRAGTVAFGHGLADPV